jgi:hypothetical protein
MFFCSFSLKPIHFFSDDSVTDILDQLSMKLQLDQQWKPPVRIAFWDAISWHSAHLGDARFIEWVSLPQSRPELGRHVRVCGASFGNQSMALYLNRMSPHASTHCDESSNFGTCDVHCVIALVVVVR